MADETKALAEIVYAPAEATKDESLTNEIATVRRNPFEFVFDGLIRPRDSTLATRGGNRGVWLYDEIERDGRVYSTLQKRKLAVVGREWRLTAASEASIDVQARDLVEQMLDALPFDRACVHLLDALLKGYAVGEIVWGVVDGKFLPVDLLDKDARRFVFDEFRNTRMLTWGNLIKGEALPDRKFIVHRFGAKDGNPYGLGLGTRLFWPAFFKRQGMQFWLTFADKFGNPTPIGKYPSGAAESMKQTLRDALEAIANDVGITVPIGMEVSLLEATRSGGAGGVYDSLLRFFNDDIAEIVLGESMTTSGKALGLGSNQAIIGNEVRLELVRFDAGLLAETLNRTLVKWVVELNLPNAKPPRLWWDCDEGEDLKVRAERDEILDRMGFKMRADSVKKIYGDHYDYREPVPRPPIGALSFAEQLAAAPSLAQTEQLQRVSQPALKKMLEPVVQLVEGASTLIEIRDRLDKLFPRMDSHSLALLMGEAIAASHLAGRYKVKQES
jgi:phage gp29-like protein